MSVPRLLPYGDRAVLVEVGGPAEVVALADRLRLDPLPGVADVVPAARTVLVIAHGPAELPALWERLARLRPDPAAGAESATVEVVEIEVRYDGPDLAEVGRLTGLGERGVVAAHTGQTWRVAFGGFAPGFAYLLGQDDRLHVPRRERPRTAVPAGAVALAGGYSGVYPRSSPGGWQVVGSTAARIWDLHREPPALLQPGTAVRFREAG